MWSIITPYASYYEFSKQLPSKTVLTNIKKILLRNGIYKINFIKNENGKIPPNLETK